MHHRERRDNVAICRWPGARAVKPQNFEAVGSKNENGKKIKVSGAA
jgi:hypothetical protein